MCTPTGAPMPSLSDGTVALAPRDDHRQLVRCGAELVEVTERFYRGLFVGGVVLVGLASLAALVLLPWRNSAPTGGPPITVVTTAMIVALTPIAVWRSAALYRLLRRRWQLEVALVLLAAALIAYPLRSELWWPSCALMMLVAILAPLPRTLAYCLVVLLANLAAHVIAGDLLDAPAVAILGLWIGYPFWSATFSVVSDRFAAHILQLQTSSRTEVRPPVRVRAWVDPYAAATPGECAREADDEESDTDDEESDTAPSASPFGTAMGRLTARQLQVTALLIDGLRYRDIAACLSISERQVQRHVANATARAGVRSANELVALAVAEGLAPPRR